MMRRKLLVWLLVLFLGIIYLPINVSATNTINDTITYVNPLYEDVLDEEQISQLISQQNQSSLLRRTGTSAQIYTTIEDAAKYIRNELIARNTNVTMQFDSKSDDYETLYKSIIDEALLHTGNPNEGDYIYYHLGGYRFSGNFFVSNDGTHHYTFIFEFVYYTNSAQEKAVDEEVPKIIEQLDLKDKSDYEKIKAIYDYICNHVTYDYEHLYDDDYLLQYTAYAALVNKTCVCQGYANLFYRLALEAGVDARIVSGKSSGGNHAWNIVELDGQYYNLDSTWDAGYYPNYDWFLKSMDEFDDHTRGAEFDSHFDKEYPMSALSYTNDISIETSYPYQYTVDNNRVNIFQCKDTNDSITIPSTIDGLEVTSIQNYAFYKNSQLINITIPKCVKKIGNFVFKNPQNIKMTVYEDSYALQYAQDHSIPYIVIKEVKDITLNKNTLTLDINANKQLIATINPSDATDKTVTWTSSNDKIAIVDNTGLVTAIAQGEVTIMASTNNGKTASCTITVVNTIHSHKWDEGTVTKYPTCVEEGIRTYHCEGCSQTKDEPISMIDHQWKTEYTIDVPATTTAEGQKSIHCSVCDTIKEGTKVSIPKVVIPITSVKLNKTSVSVYKGKTYQLTATVSPTNTTNSKTIKWTSSNTKVATVSSSGKITGINYGKATITATASNGKKATCTVTVPYTITYKLNYGTNSKYNPSSYYGTKITLKNPTRKGYTFAGWYTDSRFKTRITSFSSGNKTVYAKWTKVTVSKAKAPTLTNLSGRKLKITYSATSGAKGYQIQYATNSKFSKATTKTLTGRSATYTLTKGKTYYVRVRAYKIDSTGAKVYGSWSSVKSKKIVR